MNTGHLTRRLAAIAMALAAAAGTTALAETVYEATDALVGIAASDVDGTTAALRSLMKAAGAEARTESVKIHFAARKYRINHNLPVYSNMTLELDEGAVVESSAADETGLLLAQHFNSVGEQCERTEATCNHGGYSQIENVTISGGVWNRNCPTTLDAYGFRFLHGRNLTIRNLTIKGCSDHMFNLSGSRDVLIEGVTFTGAVKYSGSDKSFWGDYRIGDETRYNTIEAVHLDYCSKEGEPNGYPLDATPCANVTIRNCTFNGAFSGIGTHHLPSGPRGADIVVENCTFKGSSYLCYGFGYDRLTLKGNTVVGGKGLVNVSGSAVTAQDNKVEKATDNAAYVYNGSDGTFLGNVFASGDLAAIRADGNSSLAVSGNRISNVKNHGVTITGGKLAATGNTIESVGGNGVYVDAASGVVSSNTIVSPKLAGIRCDNGATLTAERNSVKSAVKYGISIGAKSSFKLRNNVITAPELNGIRIEGAAAKGEISGNAIETKKESGVFIQDTKSVSLTGNTITKAKQNGVYVTASSVTASNNTVLECGTAGFRADNKSSLTASGNTITRPGTFGFSIAGNSSYSLSNNRISKAAIAGVFADSAAKKGTVSGNVITDSSERGIFIRDTDSPTVSGNTVTTTKKSEGIYVLGAKTSTISNNNVTKTAGYAIRVQGASAKKKTTATISGNTAGTKSKDVSDIRIGDYCSKCKLSGNTTLSAKGLSESKTGTSGTVVVPPQYNVAFDGNGATSGSMKAMSLSVGTAKALTANKFKRTGYAFQGWATTPTAKKAAYKNKAKVKDLAKVDGATVTLYAVWKGNSYKIAFNANGGKGTMAKQSATYGKTVALTANKFKRTNYVFAGWSVNKKAKAADYGNKAKVSNLAASGTATLYAVWRKPAYTVTFDGNGATSGSVGAQTIEVDASKALAANKFARTGYTFLGWATSRSATAAAYRNNAKVKNLAKKDGATVPLFAVWKPNAYKVAFNANGGMGAMALAAATYDQATALPANAFTRLNYTFVGWATSPDAATVVYGDKASVMNLMTSGSITLYAVWERDTYTVAFDANGGTGTMDDQTVNTAESVELPANEFAREDHEFLGWSDEAEATVAKYADMQAVQDLAGVNETVTLYAVWKRDTYTVAFDANGGTGTMDDQDFETNTDALTGLAANAFVRPGFEFVGWATDKDATAAEYGDGQPVNNLADVDEQVTLYAIWSLPGCVWGTYYGFFDADLGDSEWPYGCKLTVSPTGTVELVVRDCNGDEDQMSAALEYNEEAGDYRFAVVVDLETADVIAGAIVTNAIAEGAYIGCLTGSETTNDTAVATMAAYQDAYLANPAGVVLPTFDPEGDKTFVTNAVFTSTRFAGEDLGVTGVLTLDFGADGVVTPTFVRDDSVEYAMSPARLTPYQVNGDGSVAARLWVMGYCTDGGEVPVEAALGVAMDLAIPCDPTGAAQASEITVTAMDLVVVEIPEEVPEEIPEAGD